jgi:LysM repeat protein
MECYACDQEATRHCSRCGKGYCPAHGDDPEGGGQGLCAECLSPVNAAPSNIVFRSSLFALLIASVLALWLLVRPPDLPGEADSSVQPQPTAGAPPDGTKPADFPTPTGAADATPTPAAETPAPETPPAAAQYTVVEGDTWLGIAATLGVDPAALAAANGRTLEDFVTIGEVLVVPQ